jgi:hypothetical protein
VLFRTIYGPELEAIMEYIAHQDFVAITDIYQLFLVPSAETMPISQSSIDDALGFLIGVGLVERRQDRLFSNTMLLSRPFALNILERLAQIGSGKRTSKSPLDSFYWLLLHELFIKPRQLYLADVHKEANRLPDIIKLGGISREKINAWKRFMEYLGLGYRAFSGFVLLYSPKLLQQIIHIHIEKSQSLQDFFEGTLAQYLPFADESGKLADSIALPLLYLHEQGIIELHTIPDSPKRDYFGQSRYKGLTLKERGIR